MINISPDLSLPLDASTQKFAFLGRTGGGKTYAAQKLAEEMAKAKLQFVVLDPVGVWYGLRIAANRKDPGIQIPVFGGLHGDIPIEATGGALMADIISDRGISAIIDVSQFETDAVKNRFAQAFAERFFFRRKSAPAPVFIFIEECQEFIPENPMRGEQFMLHAFTRLGKIGRNYGIGLGLISQRPQEVNKKVLNMTECMFAFQMTGPHERKTIESWVKEKGASLDIVDILPRLEIGQAHVWSPQWLRISKTVKISPKWTLNASSTPVVGAERTEPKPLDNKDMERIREAMAETIERAKADDPQQLKRKIAELERQAPVPFDTAAIERAAEERGFARGHALAAGIRNVATGLVGDIENIAGMLAKAGDRLRTALLIDPAIAQAPFRTEGSGYGMRVTVPRSPPPGSPAAQLKAHIDRIAPKNGDSGLGNSGLRRILTALAQKNGLSARQIGVRAGLSSSSGSFATYLSKGRSEGWISGSRDRLDITPEGLKVLGGYDPLPVGRDLLAHWIGELGNSGAARILQVLADRKRSMTAEEVGEQAGLSSGSGSFATYLSKLRTLELIEGPRSELRASEDLR